VPRNRKPFAVVGAVRGLRSRLRLRQNNQANALRIEGFAGVPGSRTRPTPF
jgi:hypothetical protein